MPRLPELRREDLSPEQAAMFEAVAASRGGEIAMDGPFGVWLHSPTVGDAAQRLGRQVRFGSALPPELSELAILVCAEHWRVGFEWEVHAPIARKAGVAEDVLDAIRAGREPAAASHDQRAVHDFARSLLRNSRVPDDLYEAALQALGRQGVVDLTLLVGYYTLVAMTLNAFEVEPKAAIAWDGD